MDGFAGGRQNGVVIELSWVAPAEAFLCFADDEAVAFLDSGGQGGARGRYSYLCVDPFRVLRNVSLRELAQEIEPWRGMGGGAPVPFAGGAVGFLSYEYSSTWENVRRAQGEFPGVPDMQVGLFDTVFAWDHAERRFWLLQALHGGQARAAAALQRLHLGGAARKTPTLSWTEGVTRAAHAERVGRTLAYILAGDIYQANITAWFSAPRTKAVRAADVFVAMRTANTAPFSAFISTGGGCGVASVSPERFLRLGTDGCIETRPIKGTRPRGEDSAEDAALAAGLLSSAKDRAENLMIVDLLRNDLSRVAVPGTVRVPALHVLESFASVHHLVSVVEAQLRPENSAIDLLRAASPGGSITGAPKIRAMEIIAELENAARGPYCGTAFWLGFDGAMDSNILIRTVTITEDRIVAQAGGGIVADSDPAEEWDELMVKIRPILRALDPAWG